MKVPASTLLVLENGNSLLISGAPLLRPPCWISERMQAIDHFVAALSGGRGNGINGIELTGCISTNRDTADRAPIPRIDLTE
jgi:hypothetical protein